MENIHTSIRWLDKLDVSDTPLGFMGRPLPLFIQFPVDSNSKNHRQNCLAYHSVVVLTADQIDARFKSNKDLINRMRRSRAYLWLKEHTRQQIRFALQQVDSSERGPMRDALNEQDQQIKNHQAGATYE